MNDVKAGVYWLASYPKSGNTWMRSFIHGAHKLKGLVEEGQTPHLENDIDLPLTETGLIDINSIKTGFMGSSRNIVQQILGFDLSDFTADEVDTYRPMAYERYMREVKGLHYHKIHDAYTYLADGSPLFPSGPNVKVLYLVRNPYDVAISYAHHSALTLDQSISVLNKTDAYISNPEQSIFSQLRQQLLSWSMHVDSWLKAKDLTVKLVRYEDMRQNTVDTFADVADFLQLDCSRKEVEWLLNELRIEKLQKQEQEKGFLEKPTKAASFFRKGVVGDWEQTLSQSQIGEITQHHSQMMQQLGYLDTNNIPTALIRSSK